MISTYLKSVQEDGFSGDCHEALDHRFVASLDNSIYQRVPKAVVFPKSHQDVVILMRVALLFPEVTFSARGAGTGTNGQSLHDGIMVDFSRYLNKILALDANAQSAIVEPGVILDSLNNKAKTHSLFFAPHVSTASRATLGGMVSTDAAGKGSRKYGRTSQHILSLKTVLSDGTSWIFRKITKAEAESLAVQDTIIGRLYDIALEIAVGKKDLIQTVFPKMSRFLTGYNLDHIWDTEDDTINIVPLIAGAEGTLLWITEIELQLVPIPSFKKLCVIGYPTLEKALDEIPQIMIHEPSAVEMMDSTILQLAQKDSLYENLRGAISSKGWNALALSQQQALFLCEFEEETAEALEQKLIDFASLHNAYQCQSSRDTTLFWRMRSKGVELLTRLSGERQPIPFVEDTAVPPEHMKEYLLAFRQILDQAQVNYGMFGHADVGCVHVRPALNLSDPQDVALVKAISQQVLHLVLKYGGVFWAEHGKGMRSSLSPQFFGKELYQDLCRIKQVFDPSYKLNPGKVATPIGDLSEIEDLDGPFWKELYSSPSKEKSLLLQGVLQKSLDCNGNGACHSEKETSPMCPSFQLTRDRRHSPRGRAILFREWMQSKEETLTESVFESLELCLSCEACSSDCPVEVDIPTLKSVFLQEYYQKNTRPLSDRFLWVLEEYAPHLASLPKSLKRICNFLLSKTESYLGLQDVPMLALNSWKTLCSRLDLLVWQGNTSANHVALLQDPYLILYEPEVFIDTVWLLREQGFTVSLAPWHGNGKPYLVRGMLPEWEKQKQKMEKCMTPLWEANVSVLGLDPATTSIYKKEWPKQKSMMYFPFWAIQNFKGSGCSMVELESIHFSHCIEQSAWKGTAKAWQGLFATLGYKLKTVENSCCGMGGVWGHQKSHIKKSSSIYNRAWAPMVEEQNISVSGMSCRTQVKRFGKHKALHPISILAQELQKK